MHTACDSVSKSTLAKLTTLFKRDTNRVESKSEASGLCLASRVPLEAVLKTELRTSVAGKSR